MSLRYCVLLFCLAAAISLDAISVPIETKAATSKAHILVRSNEQGVKGNSFLTVGEGSFEEVPIKASRAFFLNMRRSGL